MKILNLMKNLRFPYGRTRKMGGEGFFLQVEGIFLIPMSPHPVAEKKKSREKNNYIITSKKIQIKRNNLSHKQ